MIEHDAFEMQVAAFHQIRGGLFPDQLWRRRGLMLNFPNQSRVFDPTRRAVRFWGHDSAMEWSFFVTEDALQRLQPDMPRDEAGLLDAFDHHRTSIYAAAMKAYKRAPKGSYELVAADF